MRELKFIVVKAAGPYVKKGFVTWVGADNVTRKTRCVKFTQQFYFDDKMVFSQATLNCTAGNEV